MAAPAPGGGFITPLLKPRKKAGFNLSFGSRAVLQNASTSLHCPHHPIPRLGPRSATAVSVPSTNEASALACPGTGNCTRTSWLNDGKHTATHACFFGSGVCGAARSVVCASEGLCRRAPFGLGPGEEARNMLACSMGT